LQTDVGSPGSRTRCLRTCTGSLTARDPGAPCDGGAPGIAFRHSPPRRHPGVPAAFAAGHGFHGSIPDLYVPLPTLRRRPRGRLRMTRGHCGSLNLQRMNLSFTTPRRFNRRTENPMKLMVLFLMAVLPARSIAQSQSRAGSGVPSAAIPKTTAVLVIETP